MFGKDPEEKRLEHQKQENRKSRKQQLHNQNLANPDDDNAAEVLKYLSNIDDLPIDAENDKILGQLVSKLTSTANLTPEQVESNEWVAEYIMLLYLCRYPKKKGMSGSWRGLAHSDRDEAIPPMEPEKRMEIESFISQSKIALTRSEKAKIIEESTRNVNESVLRDESDDEESKGGLRGKLGL